MKKLVLTLAIIVSVTGCAKRESYCERPPTLHPVTTCDDCRWNEL